MKPLASICGVVAALTIVHTAAGQEEGKSIIIRPAVVLIEAKTKGIAEGAKVEAIDVPKETVAKKLLRDVRLKRKGSKGLDREYVVKSAKVTLADGTVVECQALLADDVPGKTTLKDLQAMTMEAVGEEGAGTWYGFLARYEVVLDASKDSPAKKKDMEKLQGGWRVVSSQVPPDELSPQVRFGVGALTVKGNKLTYDLQDKEGDKYFGTMDIDPATKAFDLPSYPGEAVGLGIYDLDGDDLRIAFGVDCLYRPKGFEMPKDGVSWLLVLKRQKP